MPIPIATPPASQLAHAAAVHDQHLNTTAQTDAPPATAPAPAPPRLPRAPESSTSRKLAGSVRGTPRASPQASRAPTPELVETMARSTSPSHVDAGGASPANTSGPP